MTISSFDFTIVISSYNRDDKILETLNYLFKSEIEEFNKIELIVIDDGSPRPVADILPELGEIPGKFEMRILTQENSGIGATRNRGFREARSNIILFLDDDILVKKETLKEIYDAQKMHPGSVVFGSYPFVSHESESLRQFSQKLYGYEQSAEEPVFERVEEMISGAISVDKTKLEGLDGLYKDNMTIPAAEEYEAISRFAKLGIPLIRAGHITAIHNHHLKLDWMVQQQYKYGLGAAEAFQKYPEAAEHSEFEVLKSKLDSLEKIGAISMMKLVSASGIGRRMLLFAASSLEKLFPNSNHNFVFGWLTSSYYWAGYLNGLKRFKEGKRPRLMKA